MDVDAPKLAIVDEALGDEMPLPRDNGELVFEEPWQGRALGMGVVALAPLTEVWSRLSIISSMA